MADTDDSEESIGYPRKSYTYKVVDQHEIHLDVYSAPGASARPVILWLHGGGLMLGSKRMLPPEQARRYLDSGFTIVAADYRLAPETRAQEILIDVIAAYHWIRRHAEEVGVDAERIAVVGHSAGGFLALSLGARLEPPPKAVVAFYGYGDISGAWASQPNLVYRQQGLIAAEEACRNVGRSQLSASDVETRLSLYLYCRQQGSWAREIVGADYHNLERLRKRYCPLYGITPDYPPTFLLHGDEDTDVPVTESLALADRLAQTAVEHEKLILRGYEHGFDMSAQGLHDPRVDEAFKAMLSFLRRHV